MDPDGRRDHGRRFNRGARTCDVCHAGYGGAGLTRLCDPDCPRRSGLRREDLGRILDGITTRNRVPRGLSGALAEADARADIQMDSAEAEIAELEVRIRQLRARVDILCQRRQIFQELMREAWRPPQAVVARRSTQPESEPAVSEFGDTLHG